MAKGESIDLTAADATIAPANGFLNKILIYNV